MLQNTTNTAWKLTAGQDTNQMPENNTDYIFSKLLTRLNPFINILKSGESNNNSQVALPLPTRHVLSVTS